jgi:uncharacterized membrane protein YedE/YeeE
MIRHIITALASGVLFGAGLAVSGMADPARVRGFLDIFGPWDPTLVFVMAGAVLVMTVAWLMKRRTTRPVIALQYHIPAIQPLDVPLIAGGMLFGIGWGMTGLCPGPAIADLALAPRTAAEFVSAMLAGMLLHRFAFASMGKTDLKKAGRSRLHHGRSS